MNQSPTLDYRLPESLPQDLEQLRQLTEQFSRGDIPAARYQAFRVPQGIYEQRESGTFMLRVRLPAGVFLPPQMRAVAAISRAHGTGPLHLTTRQDVQIHGVAVAGIVPAVEALAQAELSTKGGGGNTVRSIVGCPHAGVCAKEVFDVTEGTLALTEQLLADPLSFQLPRKYKLALSGCGQDCAGATVNDLGFIAKDHEGQQGFAVYVGGGLGAKSRTATLLEPFIPQAQAPRVAEAVKRVFDQHGNRKNRHRARLRFLLEDLGFEAFKKLYGQALAALPEVAPARSRVAPPSVPEPVPAKVQAVGTPASGFERWAETSVAPQKQAGFHTVEISAPLGMLEPDQLAGLADVVERFGERQLRATNWQHLVLRWVSEAQLSELFAALAALGLAQAQPALLNHLTSCTGSSTCRLGICLSRGLSGAIATAIARSGLDLSGPAGELSLHISGCPNACGRHPVAKIGLYGAARRVEGHLVPHYVVQLGGHVEEGKTVLAEGGTPIPARNVPAFVVDLLKAFKEAPLLGDFATFLSAGGRQAAEELLERHAHTPGFDEDKNYYYDWGARELFSLAGRGPGECGAGVFDLIEVDLASAAEALAANRLFAATALAARALLVTRGEQADTDVQSLALFRKHFIEQDLIPAGLHPLVDRALEASRSAEGQPQFAALPQDVASLLEEVKGIYVGMGPSLRVATPPAAACGIPPIPAPAAALATADQSVDFRGVVCPLNYIKTKMALARLQTGQTLAVLLDQQGATNVPASAAGDGHEVLQVAQLADHWRVVIQKKG
jgi:sulfite reductase (ferredoxin)